MTYSRFKAIGNWLGIAAGLNLALFFILTIYLGGEAGNGTIVDTQFLLNNHGTFVEATESEFRSSLFLSRLLFITYPLAILWWIASKTLVKFFPDRREG